MAPDSSDMNQPNRKILQRRTNFLFFSYLILKELHEICQTVSDRPKIIEKFSQPADENGHVLLPGCIIASAASRDRDAATRHLTARCRYLWNIQTKEL